MGRTIPDGMDETMTDFRQYKHLPGVTYPPDGSPEYNIEAGRNGERDMCGPTARCTDCGCMRMNHVNDGACNKMKNGKQGRRPCGCVKFKHPRYQEGEE